MKTSYVFGLLFLLCGLLPVSARAQEPPPVVISEINWAGSALTTADEWIELYNTTSESVDLSGWVLTGSATSGDALALEAGTTIAAHKTLLVSNYPLDHEKTTLSTAPDLVTSSLSLPNSGLEIMLATQDGTVVDEVSFSGTPDAGSKEPIASAQRNLTTLEFVTANHSANLKDTTQLGSPGIVEQTTQDPVEPPEEAEEPTETEQVTEVEASVATQNSEEEPAPHDCPTEETSTNTPPENSTETISEEVTQEPAAHESQSATQTETETNTQVNEEPPEVETDPDFFTLGAVLLNEFVSAPEDGTEWIELYNPGTHTISLEGWFVTDATERATILEALMIAPGEFVVVENPSGKLNNSGDDIYLFDPSGKRIDSVSYGTEFITAPAAGESLSRSEDDWFTTTLITKGETNMFPEQETLSVLSTEYEDDQQEPTNEVLTDYPTAEQEDVQTSEPASTSSDPVHTNANVEPIELNQNTKTHKVISVASSPTSKATTKTTSVPSSATTSEENRYNGRVTALPGTFGDQIAFINGTQVYSHFSDWPELSLGDVVTITGEPSTSRGESRVKIKSASDVRVVEHEDEVVNALSVSDAQNQKIGTLVEVNVEIVERDGNVLVVKDDTAEMTIVAHNKTDIEFDNIAHTQLTIRGIVRTLNGTPALYPRSMADITQHAPTNNDPVAKLVGASISSPPNTAPWIGGGLVLATTSGLAVLYMRKHNLLPNLN